MKDSGSMKYILLTVNRKPVVSMNNCYHKQKLFPQLPCLMQQVSLL